MASAPPSSAPRWRRASTSLTPPTPTAGAPAVAGGGGRRGLRPEQPPYSVLCRGIERSVLPLCQRHRMGVLTWSPLAWGFLTGRIRRGVPVDLSAGRAASNPARFDPAL